MSTSIGPNQRRAHTVRQVAELLGLSQKQVRNLIQAGKLRTRSTGRMYLIPDSALNEYLDGSDDPIAHPDSMRRVS